MLYIIKVLIFTEVTSYVYIFAQPIVTSAPPCFLCQLHVNCYRLMHARCSEFKDCSACEFDKKNFEALPLALVLESGITCSARKCLVH